MDLGISDSDMLKKKEKLGVVVDFGLERALRD